MGARLAARAFTVHDTRRRRTMTREDYRTVLMMIADVAVCKPIDGTYLMQVVDAIF